MCSEIHSITRTFLSRNRKRIPSPILCKEYFCPSDCYCSVFGLLNVQLQGCWFEKSMYAQGDFSLSKFQLGILAAMFMVGLMVASVALTQFTHQISPFRLIGNSLMSNTFPVPSRKGCKVFDSMGGKGMAWWVPNWVRQSCQTGKGLTYI